VIIIKSITDYNKEEMDMQREVWSDLKDKIDKCGSDLIDYKKYPRYGRYTFEGEYTDKLVEVIGHEPTPDEIIMIVDCGFTHFGAKCYIADHRFNGEVYTE